MNAKLDEWLSGGPLLTDGGWGTQLQERGLPLGAHPDLWNQTDPEKVESVAAAYIAAGSDVILTNTFGANRFLLAKHGAEDRVAEINRLGTAISRKAADAAKASGRRVLVFASMGPSGALLLTGEVTPESLFDAFSEQADALAAGGADAIVIETMSDPAEAVQAVRAAKKTNLPVVACMTFDSGRHKDRTMMGTTPEAAVAALSDAGADVIGANCGQGIDGFIPLCRRMLAATDRPLWMKGNAGLPEMVDGKTVYRQTPEKFADKALLLLEEGASFIGGCCGTNPSYIAELRSRMDF